MELPRSHTGVADEHFYGKRGRLVSWREMIQAEGGFRGQLLTQLSIHSSGAYRVQKACVFQDGDGSEPVNPEG